MSDYSYLNSLENTYDAAQEATGGKLPDGRYTAILNEARLSVVSKPPTVMSALG